MTPPFPAGTRIISYTRDSGGNRQGESVDQQNAVIERKAGEWGWIIVRQFSDVAKSGRSDAGRKDLKALLDFAKPGVAGVVVFWNSARFGREVNDAQFYRSTLRKRGYKIYYISDPIPEAGKFTSLLEAVKDVSNADVSEKISADVKRGLDTLLFEHNCIPGQPPVGYKRERVQIGEYRDGTPHLASRWVLDPKTAPKVRKAWQMRAAGYSYRAIHEATKLYQNRSGYQKMFRRETYLGVLVLGERRIQGAIEPLCTEAQWRAVQRLIASPAHPRSVHAKFILSRLLVCKKCGAHLVGHAARRIEHGQIVIRRYYRCNSNAEYYHRCKAPLIRAEKIDAKVIGAVLDLLAPSHMPDIYESWHKSLIDNDKAGEIGAARESLADLDAKISNLLDQAESGRAVADRLAERERERANTLARLAELESMPAAILPPIEDFDEIRVSLEKAMRTKDAETARAIVRQFVERVEAAGQEIDIFYRTPVCL